MLPFSWKRNKDRDEFFRVVRLCCADPAFDEEERDYKLQLGGCLRGAKDAVVRGDYGWRQTLIDALKPPLNNIIHWRQLPKLFKLISSPPASFRRALLNLWGGHDQLPSRIDTLAAELAKAGLLQKGFQLTTASTLLMAMGANTHPPVRSSPFRKVMIRTGTPPFGKESSPGQRYDHALQFLDTLIREARRFRINLRDRLDAQSVLWCIREGDDWVLEQASLSRNENSKLGDIPEPPNLTKTQRQGVVDIRLGQSRFREDLLYFWGRCAVTGRGTPRLLRASHLKPWKPSSNRERTNLFNGLLLLPNLDFALDRGFISFRNDGRILISPQLSADEKTALGLSATMRLWQRPLKQHHRFLKYHRDSVFRSDG